ncbi:MULTISPECIES: thermostable hemolysin [unclassified Rhizobium]|uniref:thermostable hemolysin n=1 Tax=unclassified Rhizobium TaxID=2613769 RepID=UPI003827C2F6
MTRADVRRPSAEALIVDIFERCYGAHVSAFPEALIAKFDIDEQQPVCAAGLRFARDGFFSEQYLDQPIEQILSATCEFPVKRAELIEVTSLASCSARHTFGFIRAIILYGQLLGCSWAFFTLTNRLSRLLSHLGVDLIHVANAESQRVSRGADWGSYYSHGPRVFALRNPAYSMATHSIKERRHALSL